MGQQPLSTEFALAPNGSAAVVPNRMDLDETTLLANLRAVQNAGGLPMDGALRLLEGAAGTESGPQPVRFPNFSVEMETGTGKTYVYLRTILELHRQYGLRKFLIVVPGVAIREGARKAFDATFEHFRALFGSVPRRCQLYDSARPARLRQFALSDGVELLILTLDAFNKECNRVRRLSEEFDGATPLQLLQATRPVLILDEPQNMESERSVAALASLGPLVALRYSATHRDAYNLVFRLTPGDAYRRGLVKRIEVASVTEAADSGAASIYLEGIRSTARTLTARLRVRVQGVDGLPELRSLAVRAGTSLEEKCGLTEYAGYHVEEIQADRGRVRFANGLELRIGQAAGVSREVLFRAQIGCALEAHFRKQAVLRRCGVKVLTLFFLDRVDNYATEDGLVRRLFREEFLRLREAYPEWREVDPDTVQAAYFAQRRRRDGSVDLLDSTDGRRAEDERAYQLIMRDRERLLSFAEPVAFLFSHSALREGWDNPNVAQICTLAAARSELRKRQEIGRGVRLFVNQQGERVTAAELNVLTVIANERYEDFVASLQAETRADTGEVPPPPYRVGGEREPAGEECGARHTSVRSAPPAPRAEPGGAGSEQTADLPAMLGSAELVVELAAGLRRRLGAAGSISVVRGELRLHGDRIAEGPTTSSRQSGGASDFRLPNVVDLIQQRLDEVAPPLRLTRRTVREILDRSGCIHHALDDPHGFARVAASVVIELLQES